LTDAGFAARFSHPNFFLNVSKAMQRSFSHTLMALALAAASLQTLAAEPVAAISPASASVRAGESAVQLLPVTARDTLWDIAGRAIAGEVKGSVSRNQAMVAILRRNPDAFVGGHLSRLRKGAVITLPTLAELRAEDPVKASALVASQQGLESQRKAPPLYGLTASAGEAVPPVTTPVPIVAAAGLPSAASTVAVAVPAPSSSVVTAASHVEKSAAPAAVSTPAVVSAASVADVGRGDGNAWAWTIGLIIVTVGAGVLVYVLRRAPSEQVMAEAAAVMEAAATKRASLRAPTTVSTAALDLAKKLEQHQSAVWMVQKADELPQQGPNVLAESALRLVLARAYLEIKNRDASRKQLEIVLRDGDEGQKEEAHGAMARL
jgi:FimV-like protein